MKTELLAQTGWRGKLNDRVLSAAFRTLEDLLGCGLATAQGDLLFVALFAATSVVAIIEAIRRLR